MHARYFLTRFVQSLIAFFIIATLLFFLFRLSLPDPTVALITEGLGQEAREIVRERFGLNLPLHQQYLIYLKNLIQGDFGISFSYKAPINTFLWDRLANTLVLMLVAVFFAYLVSVPLGALLSWKRGTVLDSVLSVVVLGLRSAPMFWTGMLLLMVFGVQLQWFPISGMRTLPYTASSFFGKVLTLDFLRHLILPSLTVALYYIASPLLVMRTAMLELYGEDFIRAARAKGLSEAAVLYFHAARNALLPVVTQLATTIGLAAGGQVVVEVVFSWPGVGREILNAVRASDFPLAQTSFLVIATMVIVLNFLADVTYTFLDPRVRY